MKKILKNNLEFCLIHIFPKVFNGDFMVRVTLSNSKLKIFLDFQIFDFLIKKN